MDQDTDHAPAGALMRGIAAGAAGTAAMTAAQTAYYKATGQEGSDTPAEAGKRIIGGLLKRPVPEDRDALLNTAMHWAYGTGWGALLGLAAAGRRPGSGLLFGLTVWGASLVHLPAMGLAPPVWEYDPKTLATDVGFHLVYGVAAATAYKALA
jgi:hypothetical protein